MTKEQPARHRLLLRVIIWLSPIAIFFLPWRGGGVDAASLRIDVNASLIDIQAEQVPLIEILRAISDETGIGVETRDSLETPVSLDLKGLSIEKCLQQLLHHQNYALTYTKTGDDFVLVRVSVIGSSSLRRMEPAPDAQTQMAQDDPMKHYQKSWFAQTFEDSEGLAKQIEGEAIEESDGGMPGFRISTVDPDSVFYLIGLRAEDQIQDVNGETVKSAREFVDTLQRISGETIGMIRIARANKDPIYIRLH